MLAVVSSLGFGLLSSVYVAAVVSLTSRFCSHLMPSLVSSDLQTSRRRFLSWWHFFGRCLGLIASAAPLPDVCVPFFHEWSFVLAHLCQLGVNPVTSAEQ